MLAFVRKRMVPPVFDPVIGVDRDRLSNRMS
jgi:hypothetical protein